MSIVAELPGQDGRQPLTASVNQHHVDFVRLGKGTLRCALRVGQRLIEAKSHFQDQDIEAWAPREFGLSGDEADVLMRFAARNSDLAKAVFPVNQLGVSALLALFARLTSIETAGGERLYEVGQIVKRGYDTVAAARRSVGKPVRGLGLVDQWAQALGINSRSLRICLKIVNLYAPEEFRARISRPPFGWTHLVHLVTVKDPQEREQLEDDIVSNQWSAEELKARIRRQHGNRRRGSGRQSAVPRDPEEGLDQLLAGLSKLRDRCQQVWFGDRYDIVSAISDVPPEELNADLGNKIQQAVKLLEELSLLGSREAERLREGLEWVEEALGEIPGGGVGAGDDLRVPATVGAEGGGD